MDINELGTGNSRWWNLTSHSKRSITLNSQDHVRWLSWKCIRQRFFPQPGSSSFPPWALICSLICQREEILCVCVCVRVLFCFVLRHSARLHHRWEPCSDLSGDKSHQQPVSETDDVRNDHQWWGLSSTHLCCCRFTYLLLKRADSDSCASLVHFQWIHSD